MEFRYYLLVVSKDWATGGDILDGERILRVQRVGTTPEFVFQPTNTKKILFKTVCDDDTTNAYDVENNRWTPVPHGGK